MHSAANSPVESNRPSEDVPQHLAHKPVFALPYQHLDGPNCSTTTDARWITVGLAQYDTADISIKMMRHTGDKWTRQAEELPPHRVIDMTLFLAKALFGSTDEAVVFSKGTFHEQGSDIILLRQPRAAIEMKNYNRAVAEQHPLLKERLNALRDVLNELKEQGAF